jgi:quercetin dioxygenase-like cupin family protein
MASQEEKIPTAGSYKPSDLPQIRRYITDHNDKGEAIISSALPAELPAQTLYNGAKFSLGYATNTRPVTFEGGADVATYAPLLANPPGIVIPGGTVARYVDAPPLSISPMHRTVSLDYGVVLEGEVELILDSGDTQLLRRGDLVIQRGSMHAWRNPSATEWNRMLYFLQESKPIVVGGKKLEEDYGSMSGHVEKSGK